MIVIKEALAKMVFANALKDSLANIVRKNYVLIIVMEMVLAIMVNVFAKLDLQVDNINRIAHNNIFFILTRNLKFSFLNYFKYIFV